MFIAALELYDRCERQAKLTELERLPPLHAIAALFDGFIAPAGKRRGCFLTNTAIEMAPHDRDIGRRVAAAQRELESFFRQQVERGQHDGSIAPSLDPAGSAAALLATLLGFLVLARSRPEPELLRMVAGEALARLRNGDSGRTAHRQH